MSKQTINIGASPNDGTGTPLRTSFDYTNQNFTEIYTALGGGVALPGATTQVIFNDGGTNLAGDAGLVYNKTTDALTVAGLVTAGSATITGDLTVRTSKLFVNATGVGIGNTGPLSALTVSSQTDARLSVRTTESVFGTIAGGTALDSLNDAGNALVPFGCRGSTISFAASGQNIGLQLDASSNVNVPLGNVVMGTSGKGIDFSATASGSGTMTSELLNDYEEGTWTGSLLGVTTNPTVPVTATGSYTKIGRIVRIAIQFSNVSTVGASGQLTVSGIPFTNSSIAAIGNAFIGNSIVTITGPVFSAVGSGASSNVDLVCQLTSGDTTTADHSAGTGKYLTINTVYTV